MPGRFFRHLTTLMNQARSERAYSPYFDTLLKQFPNQKIEFGYVFPTFRYLFLDGIVTGQTDRAFKYRQV